MTATDAQQRRPALTAGMLAPIIAAADAAAAAQAAATERRHAGRQRVDVVRCGDIGYVPAPPERAQLQRLVGALPPPARHELMAVMWIGRGDEPASRFADAVAYARQGSDAGDVDYICEKLPLADYLRKGVKRLRATRP
jgi:Protein of unknown function (DUF3775)